MWKQLFLVVLVSGCVASNDVAPRPEAEHQEDIGDVEELGGWNASTAACTQSLDDPELLGQFNALIAQCESQGCGALDRDLYLDKDSGCYRGYVGCVCSN